MNHCILVKWNESVTDKAAMLKEIAPVFAPSAEIAGVEGVRIIPNCIDRSNRYDCMIVIRMEKDALPAWDASETHRTWKERYGERIEKKAIFDWEE